MFFFSQAPNIQFLPVFFRWCLFKTPSPSRQQFYDSLMVWSPEPNTIFPVGSERCRKQTCLFPESRTILQPNSALTFWHSQTYWTCRLKSLTVFYSCYTYVPTSSALWLWNWLLDSSVICTVPIKSQIKFSESKTEVMLTMKKF